MSRHREGARIIPARIAFFFVVMDERDVLELDPWVSAARGDQQVEAFSEI
jgi:hypothetical protein